MCKRDSHVQRRQEKPCHTFSTNHQSQLVLIFPCFVPTHHVSFLWILIGSWCIVIQLWLAIRWFTIWTKNYSAELTNCETEYFSLVLFTCFFLLSLIFQSVSILYCCSFKQLFSKILSYFWVGICFKVADIIIMFAVFLKIIETLVLWRPIARFFFRYSRPWLGSVN